MKTEIKPESDGFAIPRALFSCSQPGCCEEVSYYADQLYWYAAGKRWVCENCWEDLPAPTNDDDKPTRGITLAEYIIGRELPAVALLHKTSQQDGASVGSSALVRLRPGVIDDAGVDRYGRQLGSVAGAPGSAFQREYLGVPWTPSPEEKRLRELAREYHERTEAYDRTICTGPIGRGGIMPATIDQQALINRHAGTVRDELGIEAARQGFSPKQWREAISNAAHEMPNAKVSDPAGRTETKP